MKQRRKKIKSWDIKDGTMWSKFTMFIKTLGYVNKKNKKKEGKKEGSHKFDEDIKTLTLFL